MTRCVISRGCQKQPFGTEYQYWMLSILVVFFALLPASAALAGDTVTIQFEAPQRNQARAGTPWDTGAAMLLGRPRDVEPDIRICLYAVGTSMGDCAEVCVDSPRCTVTLPAPTGGVAMLVVEDADAFNASDLILTEQVYRDKPCNPCTQGAGLFQARYWITGWTGGEDRPTAACPTPEAKETVSSMLSGNWHVTDDFPRDWQSPRWSFAVPTAREADEYLANLLQEHAAILARAEASGRIDRVMSAAYWVIDRSDPSEHVVRTRSYKGEACDMIRNRFVAGCGADVYDCVASSLGAGSSILTDPLDFGTRRTEANKRIQKSVEACSILAVEESATPEPVKRGANQAAVGVLNCMMGYRRADEIIDEIVLPAPYSQQREELLLSVAKRTAEALGRIGHGVCNYYSDAVRGWDAQHWKHNTLRQTQPVEGQHDFLKAAWACLGGR